MMIILCHCSDPNAQRFVSQTVVQQPVSASAQLGEPVALQCSITSQRTDHSNQTSLLWYKQSIGYVPQKVASIVSSRHVKFFPPFDSSFTVKEPDIDLNIKSVSKEDEAHYFCQNYYSNDWSGFFLSVKGKLSTQLGDPVALQCSITSQRTDHSNQCQGEPSVYWFRSGPSHPAAIYMNGNRSGECQDSSGPSAPQSCVYTLPKNKVDSSDAGTYYCALAACGEVVFGNGTKLDITEKRKSRFQFVYSFLRFVKKTKITISVRLFVFWFLLSETNLPLNIWFPPVGGSSYWLACFIDLCSS
uniref:Ig-like domain-containing protein n=1 Tax=Gadus morhua TaxID=8049 RepID=A0A8C5CVD3_GADMO